ncbi:MAG: hypothetical protein ABSA48_14990 [Terracidiphilus sp.]|jgi:hypothetical protein
MRKIIVVSVMLLAFVLLAMAQSETATCPYDGAQASATGATRQNPHAPPAEECQYSHKYWDTDHWATHTFLLPCGM